MPSQQQVTTKTGFQAEAMDMRGGAKYVTVAQRVQEAHHATGFEPGYSIVRSELLMIGDGHYWQVEIEVAGRRFTGTASVGFGGKGADQTNPVENAETSALGRALGFAGFGSIDSIASADEVHEAKRRQADGYQSKAPAKTGGYQPKVKPPAASETLFQRPAQPVLDDIMRIAKLLEPPLVGEEFKNWLKATHNTTYQRMSDEVARLVLNDLQELAADQSVGAA